MQRLIYSIFSLLIGNFDLSTQLSWAVVLEAEDFFSFPAVQKAAVAHKATGAQVLATEIGAIFKHVEISTRNQFRVSILYTMSNILKMNV